MIRALRMGTIGKDTAFIMNNGLGIDGGRHGAADKNFRLDMCDDIGIVIDHTILQDGGVGKVVNFRTSAAHSGERITRLANITCLTRSINMGTESVRGFVAASKVGLASVIRNESRCLLDEFIDARVITAVATTGFFRGTI